MEFKFDWERAALLELTQEYARICRERKVSLRPASIQLFDSQSLWGQFNPLTRSISISRKLIENQSWQNVLGVFRHEMAHQHVFEKDPAEYNQKPHGEIFQNACSVLGVPFQFTKAKIGFQDSSLDWKDEAEDTSDHKMLDKVKKLLSLAQSANIHESGLAMQKVQELYAQYNINKFAIPGLDRSQYVHLIIAEGKKRKNTWEQRIISLLLESFFVEIIILQQYNPQTAEKNQAFEIIGTRENVLMAEYVYYFLLNQVEVLLKQSNAKSRNEKASFRLGIIEGFAAKLRCPETVILNQKEISTVQKALILFKSNSSLEKYLKDIYPRLSFKKSSSRVIDTRSFYAGQKEGQKLVLNKPLENSKKSGLFIS